jgi:hypothetical protein
MDNLSVKTLYIIKHYLMFISRRVLKMYVSPTPAVWNLQVLMRNMSDKIIIHFRGMTVTSGSVTITKDNSNLIGISIGGGATQCPCLYIVQVNI